MMILRILFKLIDFYTIIILISVLGSWMDPRRTSPLFNASRKVTDPFLNLFKIIIPIGNGGLDISPVIAFMILRLIKEILIRIVYF